MMWIEEEKTCRQQQSDGESDTSGEELPIWIRGEQRWVSGIVAETTCQDIISVLVKDEQTRGKRVNSIEQYHITERWRGVEQPLDPQARILDIWNAWGTAQPEVKILLRKIKDDRSQRRKRCRSDSSTWSDRSAYRTVHPRRLNALQSEGQTSSTEQLIKLVLAQGEVIKRQLRKLRHSEHQIGFLEEKAHKARARKHGSNYLLETYLKGLSEATAPGLEENPSADKHSDSGVVTEGDSEQSNTNKASSSTENERLTPSSDELQKELKEDEDTFSNSSESTIREQREIFEMINKINKKLLKEEECLVRLHTNIKKYDKEMRNNSEQVQKSLSVLRTEMAKSSCEMQHNQVVLEETMERLMNRKTYLENLHKDLQNEDHEHEMLQTLLYTTKYKQPPVRDYHHYSPYHTKEVLDTLV